MSELIASMLQSGDSKKPASSGAPLIQDLSLSQQEDRKVEKTDDPDDGPTMLELMMQAQSEAKKQKDVVVAKEAEKNSKTFGGGFKKGFLGGSSTKPKPSAGASKTVSAKTKDACSTTDSSTDTIPVVRPKERSQTTGGVTSSIQREVDEAMKKDADPMMQKIQGGEWVTPDLLEVLQSNPVLGNGLKNPKCMAALQLMQKSPAEAKARFGNDPDVNAFVMEFGRVMGSHFTSLGEKESKANSNPNDPAKKGPSISELQPGDSRPESASTLGPLAKAAVERELSKKEVNLNIDSNEVSEKQVQEVLQNDELRQMLEDPSLQQILCECGDRKSVV